MAPGLQPRMRQNAIGIGKSGTEDSYGSSIFDVLAERFQRRRNTTNIPLSYFKDNSFLGLDQSLKMTHLIVGIKSINMGDIVVCKTDNSSYEFRFDGNYKFTCTNTDTKGDGKDALGQQSILRVKKILDESNGKEIIILDFAGIETSKLKSVKLIKLPSTGKQSIQPEPLETHIQSIPNAINSHVIEVQQVLKVVPSPLYIEYRDSREQGKISLLEITNKDNGVYIKDVGTDRPSGTQGETSRIWTRLRITANPGGTLHLERLKGNSNANQDTYVMHLSRPQTINRMQD